MALGIKVGGTWKTPNKLSVKVSGNWRAVQQIYAKAGGVWRPIWSIAPTMRKGYVWGSNSYVVKQSDHVECYAYNSSTGGGEAAVVTNIPVDLTGVSYVVFDYALEGSSDIQSDGIFIASSSQMGGAGTFEARTYRGSLTTRTTVSLSVSSLSGPYYLRAHASNNGGVAVWKRVRLYRILLDSKEIWNASAGGSYV
ncbi:hypothetical protein EL84_12650 [Paenibacillus sp. VT-400]|uniref:hypothetical protein n=1 Tax=Paenibacillus sp. VT-400 TaxID=1495853 RepID=UPI0006494752|nr:hypothetical protein [Paenibacillus sp. VT-400]KLU53191.1 hypothetical protein EL84_12650 [Paenibacillus sp. VT-400]